MDEQQIKSRILEIINNSGGYVTADEIYNQLTQIVELDPGRTQEVIRGFIRMLVNEQDNLIGSTSHGYFKIDTTEKLEQARKYLLSRIPELQNRADSLLTAWNKLHPDNQIKEK